MLEVRASCKAENSSCYHDEITVKETALIIVADLSTRTGEISVHREIKFGGTHARNGDIVSNKQ
jgi:hypothetical protein